MPKPPETGSGPTREEFDALTARVASLEGDVVDLETQVNGLETRVVALEESATAPPDPEEPPVDPPIDPGEPPVTTAGAVTVHMNGQDYIYDPTAGSDIGTYVDPAGRFMMSCVRVTRTDCPLLLDFRSTGPDWRCVVFEYSNPLTSGLPNLTYSVSIEDNTIEVPDQWANSSWRWKSGEWPHPLTDLETLYQRKLLPRHDGALALGKAGSSKPVLDVPPMSLCGFFDAMGATGGRDDIGLVTGWQGTWLCSPTDDMLKTVLNQGEAAFNWRFRDKTTDAILDAIETYPKASVYWQNPPPGDPQVYFSSGWNPGLDAAHCPSCYYIPYILTGDPYFLEYQQSATMYCFMEIPRNPNTVVGSEQIRGVAWSLRYLYQTAAVTPDNVPKWLLPKSLFEDELEHQRGLIEAKRNDGWVYRAFAHIIDTKDRWQHAWWQHDYATAVVACISMLYPQWESLRDWMVEGVNGRSDPESGWCPGYPTSYWTNTTSKNDWYPEGSFRTWAEAWDYNANNVYTDTPGGQCPTLESRLELNTTYDYFSAMMNALRVAHQAGSAAAGPALDRLVGPWENGLRQYGYTEYKYCAAP